METKAETLSALKAIWKLYHELRSGGYEADKYGSAQIRDGHHKVEYAMHSLLSTMPAAEAIANSRAVRFNFGGDGGEFDVVFEGYTLDTYWNGWLNVYVTTDVYRRGIRPLFTGGGEPDETVLDLDKLASLADQNGTLLSLAMCYTTSEVDVAEIERREFEAENGHGFHTPRGDWPDRPSPDPYD
jgi:hypothetical protein